MSEPNPTSVQELPAALDVLLALARCEFPTPRGWYCNRGRHIHGTCALRARWWNVRAWRWLR